MNIDNQEVTEQVEIVTQPVTEEVNSSVDDTDFNAMLKQMEEDTNISLNTETNVPTNTEVTQKPVNDATKEEKVEFAKEKLLAKELGKQFAKIKETGTDLKTNPEVQEILRAEKYEWNKTALLKEYSDGNENLQQEIVKVMDRLKPSDNPEDDIKFAINYLSSETNSITVAETKKAVSNRNSTPTTTSQAVQDTPDYGNFPGLNELVKMMG